MIYILCIIFPPLAVYIRTRKIGLFFLNFFYFLFLFVPAIIHAFIIVSRNKHIKFSDRIKSEKFELVNELDKVVKHIKNQIEFNTIINDVIGEKYEPYYTNFRTESFYKVQGSNFGSAESRSVNNLVSHIHQKKKTSYEKIKTS